METQYTRAADTPLYFTTVAQELDDDWEPVSAYDSPFAARGSCVKSASKVDRSQYHHAPMPAKQ